MEELQEVRAEMFEQIQSVRNGLNPESKAMTLILKAQQNMLDIVERKIKEIENKVSKTVDK